MVSPAESSACRTARVIPRGRNGSVLSMGLIAQPMPSIAAARPLAVVGREQHGAARLGRKKPVGVAAVHETPLIDAVLQHPWMRKTVHACDDGITSLPGAQQLARGNQSVGARGLIARDQRRVPIRGDPESGVQLVEQSLAQPFGAATPRRRGRAEKERHRVRAFVASGGETLTDGWRDHVGEHADAEPPVRHRYARAFKRIGRLRVLPRQRAHRAHARAHRAAPRRAASVACALQPSGVTRPLASTHIAVMRASVRDRPAPLRRDWRSTFCLEPVARGAMSS